jgi:cell division protein FtsZ
MADEVLHSGVRGVTDLIVMPGLINLDFADIKAVISEMGKAMMGTGESEGEDRAQKAADMAICNPLLDDVSMKGARGVLINITGGPDLMLFEVEQAANRVRAEVDPDARIIFGSTIIDNMEGRIRVSVVATGIDAAEMRLARNVEPLRTAAKPVPLRPEMKVEAAPQPAVNQVARQQEALAAEMNAMPAALSQEEDYILGGAEAPEIVDEPIPVAIRPQPQPVRVQPEPQPEPERRGWGFLGRKKAMKEEPRYEPAPQPQQPAVTRVAPAPRAAAQPLTRPEPPKQSQANNVDDLFPDHKRDDQFEIPAFLRRQTN